MRLPNRKRMVLLFPAGVIVLFLSLLPLAVSEDSDSDSLDLTPLGEPLYDFSARLSEASALVRVDAEESIGQWEKDRFTFERLGERHHIRFQDGQFAGKKKSGIYFYPVRNGIKRLVFSPVPTGSNLLIEYGIEDAGVDDLQETSNVFLRIWLGNHLLKRIVASNEKGWFQETLDLGVVSFLNQDIVVTFEITSDSVQSRHFYFNAAIY